MDNNPKSLQEEIWSHFKHTQPVFLATSADDKPKVRPVTLIHHSDKFWVATGADNAKMRQIRVNNNIEFCLLLEKGENKGYIRGKGVANIIEKRETRELLSNNIPFFQEFWRDADDPNFALLEINIEEIEYLRPGGYSVERLSLK